MGIQRKEAANANGRTPRDTHPNRSLKFAEFFAGIGLVRLGLEQTGWRVVFANDIEPFKHAIYAANFNDRDFVLGDVRNVHGCDVPDIDLATASFPCTDLSLAGGRRGIDGEQSGMFWEFTRVLDEMGERRPVAVLVENVPSFATSKGGADLAAAIERLNGLGYACDLVVGDARHFVPQSRQRLFLVGSRATAKPHAKRQPAVPGFEEAEPAQQPPWLRRFVEDHPELRTRILDLDPPPPLRRTLAGVVEHLPAGDPRWWDAERTARFAGSLSPHQAARLNAMRAAQTVVWAAAYRRTRQQRAIWEIRADQISGCLRTARGGSSRQGLLRRDVARCARGG